MRGDRCRDCPGIVDRLTGKLCAECRLSAQLARIDDMRARKAGAVVYATELTKGSKLGPVSATYVAQQSCPTSCPFLGAGCYAENGFVGGFITKPLNRARPDVMPLELARIEAQMIDGLTASRDLRLHVVGDSVTIEGTKLIAAAAGRYIDSAGTKGLKVKVWTYTHAWRSVPRTAWGRVSVLASCETPYDILDAQARGYATALTVERHPGARLYDAGPLKVLPCPEQTKGVTCADCRLCTDDGRLREAGVTVAFALHGKRNVAAASLAKRRTIALEEIEVMA